MYRCMYSQLYSLVVILQSVTRVVLCLHIDSFFSFETYNFLFVEFISGSLNVLNVGHSERLEPT